MFDHLLPDNATIMIALCVYKLQHTLSSDPTWYLNLVDLLTFTYV
jgi:hypothetical protein